MKKLLLTLTLVIATVNTQASPWEKTKDFCKNYKKTIFAGLVVTAVTTTYFLDKCYNDSKIANSAKELANPVKNTIVEQYNKLIDLFNKTNNEDVVVKTDISVESVDANTTSNTKTSVKKTSSNELTARRNKRRKTIGF